MSNWADKRSEILRRDNYTCQNCKQFNPELGVVELFDEIEQNIELHEYQNCPDPFNSFYVLFHGKTNHTFEINFGDCWPVFPVMQVHHKRYIKGKETWDYANEDLVTLCKKCHFNLHLKELIPIYSEENVLVDKRMFVPVDVGNGRRHNCEEWTFIQTVGGGEYVVSDIQPTVRMVVAHGEDSTEAMEEGKKAVNKLIKNFFPRYSPEI